MAVTNALSPLPLTATPYGREHRATRLPQWLIWGTVLICVLPFFLNVLGVDFGSPKLQIDWEVVPTLPAIALTDTLHRLLSGSFTHTLLEWSAFCLAIFTVSLAFARFSITSDVTVPIIGVTLLCAGSMDAFHTLAADRLIAAVADNRNLIPFTWALCRMANAVLTLLGVSLFLMRSPFKRWRNHSLVLTGVTVGFGLLSYSVIHLCATSEHLPDTMFPDALITRPWDVAPLIVFVISGLFVFPQFYRKHPSLFSHALIISVIPNVATQLHMAFGSTALFDNHFNIAHFLKIVAYAVPLAGLVLDYSYTHRQMQRTNQNLNWEIQERVTAQQELEESERTAREQAEQLGQTLHQLQQAQTQIVQSEKMSSLGQLVAGVAHEINNPVNFIHGNLAHADDYTRDLLQLVQLYQQVYPAPPPEIADEAEAIDLEFLKEDLPRLLDSMKVGTDRIRQIVLSLRNFSRMDEADMKAVDLHAGLDSTLMILQHRLKAKADRPAINIEKQYGNLPQVECFAGQLNQVFMNILSNAVDALEDHYAATQQVPLQIDLETAIAPHDQVTVRIRDNGPGMPEAVRQRIFDPFFTTKEVGKGTGMGLSISHQIVTEKHGGTITCESTADQGTTFVITIPIHQPEAMR